MAYNPSLGKTSEDFRFIFTSREAQEKNKQKIRIHLGPVPQVSGRLCEAKPEAKSRWRCTHGFNFRFFPKFGSKKIASQSQILACQKLSDLSCAGYTILLYHTYSTSRQNLKQMIINDRELPICKCKIIQQTILRTY